ncbi:MAG: hypothetical protein HQ582_22095 [Planctomycetes bacterium]|nr:hypothetical protein [Planctomycetota bacterium]
MPEKDDGEGNISPHIFTRQLRHFDNQLSEFRQFYYSHSAEQRKQLREWLEKVSNLQEKGYDWNLNIRVHAENDVFDDNGELIRWGDAIFTPATMLRAIKAWDEGNNFTPSSVLP